MADTFELTLTKDVVATVQRWVDSSTPGAVIRFSEGEARVMYVDESRPESYGVASRKILKQTGIVLGKKDVVEIKNRLLTAFDGADILAIGGSDSWNEEYRMWMGHLKTLYMERKDVARGTLAHCFVNRPLRDALPKLLKNATRCSVVSCRDVRPWLKTNCGIDGANVKMYPVPSQYVMRNVDGEYEKALHDVKIWPVVHHRVLDSVAPRFRGEVFLVGAGLFGKDICVAIRGRGGIALDIGSCIDTMDGKATRGHGKPPPYSGPRPTKFDA